MSNIFKRISYILLPVMAFLLPFWITIGKAGLFDIGGWMAIIMLFTVAPFLFIVLLALFGILHVRPEVRKTKRAGLLDSVLLLCFYVSTILFSLFLVDGGDTKESINSVATKYFGLSDTLSGVLSMVFFCTSAALLLALFIVFITEAVTKRSLGTKA